ncbi:hypothetical protein LIER_41934 [Lithospermum erythrorhizon]|uniref:Uncharacterized protein n=1 Tax=Lithospermum erythrorhizon TaxID=34254 RepID=A0AAV3RGJ8_LITER
MHPLIIQEYSSHTQSNTFTEHTPAQPLPISPNQPTQQLQQPNYPTHPPLNLTNSNSQTILATTCPPTINPITPTNPYNHPESTLPTDSGHTIANQPSNQPITRSQLVEFAS